jgi:hypothetical protein
MLKVRQDRLLRSGDGIDRKRRDQQDANSERHPQRPPHPLPPNQDQRDREEVWVDKRSPSQSAPTYFPSLLLQELLCGFPHGGSPAPGSPEQASAIGGQPMNWQKEHERILDELNALAGRVVRNFDRDTAHLPSGPGVEQAKRRSGRELLWNGQRKISGAFAPLPDRARFLYH